MGLCAGEVRGLLTAAHALRFRGNGCMQGSRRVVLAMLPSTWHLLLLLQAYPVMWPWALQRRQSWAAQRWCWRQAGRQQRLGWGSVRGHQSINQWMLFWGPGGPDGSICLCVPMCSICLCASSRHQGGLRALTGRCCLASLALTVRFGSSGALHDGRVPGVSCHDHQRGTSVMCDAADIFPACHLC
jgi:hypothetical protein